MSLIRKVRRALVCFWCGLWAAASGSAAQGIAFTGRILVRDNPVVGARVELWDRQAPGTPVSTSTTSADGEFQLLAPLPAFWQVAARVDERSFVLDIAPRSRSFRLPSLRIDGDNLRNGWRRGRPEFCQRLQGSEPVEVSTEVPGHRPLALVFWDNLPCSAGSTGKDGRTSLPARAADSRLRVVAVGFSAVPAEAGRALLVEAGSALDGTIVDSAGRPIENAEIVVPQAEPNPDASTYSDAAGHFRLENLPKADSARMTLSHPDFEAKEILWPATSPVVLHRIGVVRGRLVDNLGRPVGGARLQARIGSKGIATAVSSATGDFLLEGLPGGKLVTLEVAARSFAATSRVLKFAVSSFDLGDWELAEGSVLERQVVDPGGHGITGATIYRVDPEARKNLLEHPPQQPETARTDTEGFFEIEAVAADAPIALEVRAPYHLPRILSAKSPEELPSPIVLERASSVAGRVHDRQGDPIIGAVVRLTPLGSDTLGAETSTNEDGSFVLEPLRAGPRQLVVESGFHLPFEKRLEITEDGLSGLEIQLDAGLSISGRVIGPQGKPVGRAYVSWTTGGEPLLERNTTAAASGNFVLDTLRPGPGSLMAFHEDFGRIVHSLELQGDSEGLELRFNETSKTDIQVLVLDEAGQPIEGATLQLDPADGPGTTRRGVSSSAGKAELAALPPGAYRLKVAHSQFVASEAVIEVPRSDRWTFQLERACSVTGSIGGLRPEELAKLTVYARQAARFAQARREPGTGNFTFEGLPPGEWRIVFELPLKGRRSFDLICDSAGAERLDLSWSSLTPD